MPGGGMIFGMSGGELAAVVTAVAGVPTAIVGSYMKLLSHFGKAERSFRMSLMAQERRCRRENNVLRADMVAMQTQMMRLERDKILAEAQLQVAGQLEKIGAHLGIRQERANAG